LSPAFCGTISGVGVANTATTGMITIPAMKNLGYPRAFAASAETMASTGGQILPRVTGSPVNLPQEVRGKGPDEGPYTGVAPCGLACSCKSEASPEVRR